MGGFYFQADYWEAVKDMPQARRREAMDAIITYAFTGDEIKLSNDVRPIFVLTRARIDAAKTKSEKVSSARNKNGTVPHKGGTYMRNKSGTVAEHFQNSSEQGSEVSKKKESKSVCINTHTLTDEGGYRARHHCKACGKPTDKKNGFCDDCERGLGL